MGKPAESMFRLYMVTTALNAGNFKQLLTAKGIQIWRIVDEKSNLTLTFIYKMDDEIIATEAMTVCNGNKELWLKFSKKNMTNILRRNYQNV